MYSTVHVAGMRKDTLCIGQAGRTSKLYVGTHPQNAEPQESAYMYVRHTYGRTHVRTRLPRTKKSMSARTTYDVRAVVIRTHGARCMYRERT